MPQRFRGIPIARSRVIGLGAGVALACAAAVAASGAAQTSGSAPQPVVVARYALSVNGSALSVNGSQVGDFRLASLNWPQVRLPQYITAGGAIVHTKRPQVSPPQMVLQRGLSFGSEDKALFAWAAAAASGNTTARLDGTLVGYSASGKAVVTFQLRGAFPSQLTLTGDNTPTGQKLVASLTLTADQITPG